MPNLAKAVSPTSDAAMRYNRLKAEWIGHLATLADTGATTDVFTDETTSNWWQTAANVVAPDGTKLAFMLLCRWMRTTGRTHTTAGCYKNGKAITQAAFHAGLDTMLAQASK